MSVNQTHYVIEGLCADLTELDYEHDDELFYKLEKQAEVEGLIVLLDGMCGRYVCVGKVLEEGDESSGIELTVLDPNSSYLKGKQKQTIVKTFNKLTGLDVDDSEISFIVLTHFS